MTTQQQSTERRDPLAVVCWPGQGGAPVKSYPLPRPLAEAVARAYTATYPRVNFWLEDIPWLPAGLSEGRPAHRSSHPVGVAHV